MTAATLKAIRRSVSWFDVIASVKASTNAMSGADIAGDFSKGSLDLMGGGGGAKGARVGASGAAMFAC